MRIYLALLLTCGASLASAADTGTMQLRVRDSHTHFPIHALVQGWARKHFLLPPTIGDMAGSFFLRESTSCRYRHQTMRP